MRHRIAILVHDGVLAVELGIVHRAFGEARGRDGEPLYEVSTCAPRRGPVRTDGDFTIEVDHGPDLLAAASTVVVIATDHDDAITAGDFATSDLAAAMRAIRPGTRVASICTAAFVLAAAGWLDGRRATTHWARIDEFRTRHPAVRVEPDVLYTDDGDVLTSAGVASAADLCLHMIRGDHGAAVGGAVARRVLSGPHREPGDAQVLAGPSEAGDEATARARSWALRHLDRTISLRDLAAQEGVSTRTLTRRFRDETGTSPLRWLLARRLDHARRLLETTALDVDTVARRSGFGSTASMRLHLRTVLDLSPTAYRRGFRR